MVEIDTLFQTKTAEKDIPFGEAHCTLSALSRASYPHSLYKGLPRGKKRVADYESHCLRKPLSYLIVHA